MPLKRPYEYNYEASYFQTCTGRLKPPLNSRAVTFADITPRLRQVGVDIFLAQMRRQRDEVRAIIKDSSTGRTTVCLLVCCFLWPYDSAF